MEPETIESLPKKHVGKNIQKIRVYLGIKQEALAGDIGLTQSAVSNIEQQAEIENELLDKIAVALGVDANLIREFDVERAVYNISNHNYRDATIADGGTAITQQFNPIEKIVDLYERLLQSEREKNEILSGKR